MTPGVVDEHVLEFPSTATWKRVLEDRSQPGAVRPVASSPVTSAVAGEDACESNELLQTLQRDPVCREPCSLRPLRIVMSVRRWNVVCSALRLKPPWGWLPRGADDALIDESLPLRNSCGPLVMLGGGVSSFPFLPSPKLQTCTVVPLLPVALSPVA